MVATYCCPRAWRQNVEMATELLDAVIETDYGQFDLVWGDGEGFEGDFDQFFDGQINGVAGAASGQGLYLNLARRSGGSPVRIVLHAHQPTLEEDQWEDVVEVSVAVPSGGGVGWTTWAGEDGGVLDLPGGSYRVRVSARGRDAGRDGELAEGALDSYLVDLWPAPPAPDSIIRTISADAAYWHREVGSRR